MHAFPLGPQDRPDLSLLVCVYCNEDKVKVFKATLLLRNTGFIVHQNFPANMRRKRTKLLLLRKHILRTNLSVNVSVFADIMKVNNQSFSWCLTQGFRFGNEDGVNKLNEFSGDIFSMKVAIPQPIS